MRALSRIGAIAAGAALALTLAVGSATAAPVGLVERFELGCTPQALISGPGGNVWFTCFQRKLSHGGRGKVGLITPAGEVSKFGKFDPNSEPRDLVVGPDGNVWFTINPGINLLPREEHPAAIGRVTPAGEMTSFRTGLSPKAVLGDIIAGADGNLWFNEGGPAPALGRITTGGEITEFRAGLVPKSSPGGLAVGAEGNIWFSDSAAAIGRISPAGEIAEFGPSPAPGSGNGGAPVVAADGNLWLTGGAQRSGIVRVSPSGAVTEFSAGLDPASTLFSPLVAGPEGTFWFTIRGQIGGATAKLGIGRVSPNGEILEHDNCLHRGPPFTGPEKIVAGPEGNLWFTSVTTRSFPNIGTAPAIGRITPFGQITEFSAGLEAEPKMILAGPDGRIWFAGNSGTGIERLGVGNATPNTFVVERARRASSSGVARLPVSIPVSGRLHLEQRALLLPHHRQRALPHVTAIATGASCGHPPLRVEAVGAARRQFRATGSARIKVRVTFTPNGGTPYTQTASVLIQR
jgi:streptogramin lyase